MYVWNIMLIVLTLWHCSWTTGSRTWPGTLCSSHQPTCGIFWFGWQWWYWWWWWCGGCAYMQFTLSPRTYVKLSLKTNQASGSGVIGLNVERDKAKEDQATFLLWCDVIIGLYGLMEKKYCDISVCGSIYCTIRNMMNMQISSMSWITSSHHIFSIKHLECINKLLNMIHIHDEHLLTLYDKVYGST